MAIEIKITGDTPLEALATLVAFGNHCASNETVSNAALRVHEKEKDWRTAENADSQPTNPTPAPVVPAPQMSPVAPSSVIPTAPSAPAPTPNTVVPGTEPPRYSVDDIARAGAELAQQGPDKITALTGLLQQFGLQAVTQLQPEQMGPFVVALRGLGARI